MQTMVLIPLLSDISDLNFNFFIFCAPVLIRHPWQLKTVVSLHWCLICANLLHRKLKNGFPLPHTKLKAEHCCLSWSRNTYWRGRFSNIDLLVSLYQLFLIMQTFLLLSKTSYLYEEVNCTKPSSYVRVPWVGIRGRWSQPEWSTQLGSTLRKSSWHCPQVLYKDGSEWQRWTL
jgi:hypothetical protein